MSSGALTTTSYVVLGLVEQHQPATAYDLKQRAQMAVVNFWSVPHTQLYTETARLASVGLLQEEREDGGRRRRIYRLTPAGRDALDAWRAEPTEELFALYDPGTVKLFFGADPARVAAAQLVAHQRKLAEYEAHHAQLSDAGTDTELPVARGIRLALESGIGHERQFVRFWSGLVDAADAGEAGARKADAGADERVA